MSSLKFHVKRGDTVQVISGNHRGSSGRILKVLPDKGQVIIEGVRLIKKHQRKTQDNPNGAIIQREGPIHDGVGAVDEDERDQRCAGPGKRQDGEGDADDASEQNHPPVIREVFEQCSCDGHQVTPCFSGRERRTRAA